MVRLVPNPGASSYKLLTWTLDAIATDNADGTDATKQATAYDIVWVKIMRNDGAHDTVSVKVGATTNDAIELPLLSRPDTDVVWEGLVNGKVYVSNSTAQAGLYLKILVGVRA